MGDTLESGKYLFLSGSTKVAHQSNIDVFLNRTKNMSISDFVSQLPNSTKNRRTSDYPDTVSTLLQERGHVFSEKKGQRPESSDDTSIGCYMAGVVFISLVVFIAVCAVRGFNESFN